MREHFTVIVSAPDAASAIAAALIGRGSQGRCEALVFESEDLVEFFERSVQRKLPHNYDLVLCGLRVVHTDWDGRLVRPALMDALRAHVGPVRWVSADGWRSEDLRAVEQMIGSENLLVDQNAESAAHLARRRFAEADDEFADRLASWAVASPDDEQGERLRRVLTALKGERRELAAAVVMLAKERVEETIDTYTERARRVEQENRRLAEERSEEPIPLGELKLVCFDLPPGKHAFWREVSAYAREQAEAPLALGRLVDRPTLLLTRDRDLRVDLRTWARYVTDLMPEATRVGARPDVVPLVVKGLNARPALKNDVLSLMKDGAHLLKD